ncbi:histidine triad nucleotide-binding protein [Salininema proteolyticum]|uniref:Histidine triad nucleotide-binding protein n=1 Tax=Salininema proteolyticum TaxID=1607685 RepID=A0ABV8TVY9_9ACTN
MTQDDCLFCKILAGEIPSTEVASNEDAYAFRDISPNAPTHVVVVPRRHYRDVADISHKEPELLGKVAALAAEVADQEGVTESGWRLVANTGPDAGQTVFHVHFHVLGGEPLGALNAE